MTPDEIRRADLERDRLLQVNSQVPAADPKPIHPDTFLVARLRAVNARLRAALDSTLCIAVQSDIYNDEQCPQEIKDRVQSARDVLNETVF